MQFKPKTYKTYKTITIHGTQIKTLLETTFKILGPNDKIIKMHDHQAYESPHQLGTFQFPGNLITLLTNAVKQQFPTKQLTKQRVNQIQILF